MSTLIGHSEPVAALAWSPDGTLLASASLDGSIRLWTPSGSLVRILDPSGPMSDVSGHSSQPVLSLAWSPDGSLLAAGGVNFGTPSAPNVPNVIPGIVRLWQPDGHLVRTLGTAQTGGKFLNVAWSPDGRLLAAGADDFGIWRPDGTPVGHIAVGGPPAWAMAWSPDSRSIATGNESGVLAVYDTAGRTTATASHDGGITHLAFSPDGAVIALGDGSVEIRATTDPAGPAIAMAGGTCCAQISPGGPVWSADSRRLAGGLGPSVWDRQGRIVSALAGCPGTPLILAWSPDGSRIAAGSDHGQVCVWPAPG